MFETSSFLRDPSVVPESKDEVDCGLGTGKFHASYPLVSNTLTGTDLVGKNGLT